MRLIDSLLMKTTLPNLDRNATLEIDLGDRKPVIYARTDLTSVPAGTFQRSRLAILAVPVSNHEHADADTGTKRST